MAPVPRLIPARPSRAAVAAVLVCAALLAAGFPADPAPDRASAPAPDIGTEAGLRAALDAIEARYEAASRKMGEARRRLLAGEAGAEAAIAEARGDLRKTFDDPLLEAILAKWAHRTTVTVDRTLTRRVRLWERGRASARFSLDPEVASLEDRLAAEHASATFVLDGRKVTRSEIERVLREDPDGARRRAAWSALVAFGRSMRDPVHRLVDLRADKVHTEKDQYHHHLVYNADNIVPIWLFNVMERMASISRPAYGALMGDLRRALGKDRLAPWDLDHAMEVLSNKSGAAEAAARSFAPSEAGKRVSALLTTLGFDPADLPVRVASTAGPTQMVPVAIPGDVVVMVSPPGPTGGLSGIDYDEAVLRAWGQALQAAMTRQEPSMLKGYPWVPGTRNAAYAAGMGEAFAAFTRDPRYLGTIAGLDGKAIDLVLKDRRSRGLLRLRRALLQLSMEFILYVNPDADLEQRYRVVYEKSLDVALPPGDAAVWAADPVYVTGPATGHNEFIAGSIAAEVHDRLRGALGADRISPRSAAWLIEHCYADGELLPLEERLARAVDGGFDFERYLAALGVGDPSP